MTKCVIMEPIDVFSGEMLVSDPSLETINEKNGVLINVRLGKWAPIVEMQYDCITSLYLIHQDYVINSRNFQSLKAPFTVEVTSRKCGIFDLLAYQNNYTLSKGTWKTAASLIINFGTVPGGVVAKAGPGNGTYDCYYRKSEEEGIIEIKIVFIDEGEIR